jgi:hypothetical protein
LKDARDSARQSALEEQQAQPPTPSTFAGADLLAGLRAQRQAEDEEEEVPDWLANITGEKPKPAKPQGESPDARWVEMGDRKDFASPEPDEKDELSDWLRAADASRAPEQQPFSFDAPPSTAAENETPDWLRSMVTDEGAGFNDTASAAGESFSVPDTPEWLRGLEAQSGAQKDSAAPAFSETPDWLSRLAVENPGTDLAPAESDAPPAFSTAGDTSDWLKGIESSVPSSGQDWQTAFQENEAPATQFPSGQPPLDANEETDIPSWLKAAAPQSSIFSESPAAKEEPPAPVSSDSELPDWLDAFKPADPAGAVPASSATGKGAIESAPADDRAKSGGEDSLFTEMPDWLSVVDETAAPESIPAPITNTDAIAPGDLPSWVQAMRPVDAGIPQSTGLPHEDRTLESRGALAGLQGVLPAAPGGIPTGKPRAYSIRLQPSEEQQAHAALLEQILSAETAPVPIDSSFPALKPSRGLRWFLAFLFFVILPVMLFMQTTIFPSPTGFPLEAVAASNVVMESITDDARVLVVFDYDSARAGEIESIAVPMFDRVMRLRYPRLTFISTNETGAILAERFIRSGPLAEIGYQGGSQYLNLGYLPGGQMGIRAFAENPIQTAKYPFAQRSNPLDLSAPPLSQSFPPLEGVGKLSNFSALILLTDNADSARAWIEQTTPLRDDTPLVVISSAQAAPMLQPYYASKQINGLAGGLYGGALFERNNEGGRSNLVRAYWDAYGTGALLAVFLMFGGGLVNLFLGLRDRRAAREAK